MSHEALRTSGNARRDDEVIKHLAGMVEEMGRAVTAMQRGNWPSTRDHLYLVRERSAFADTALNSGQPDPAAILRAVRERIPAEWRDALVAFLSDAHETTP